MFVHTGATVTCIWNCTCPGCRTASVYCAVLVVPKLHCLMVSYDSFLTQAEGKAVLITGCDKGFGHALAKCLHAKGFTVFAGCLLMVSSEIDQFFFQLEKNASQVRASSFAASVYPGSRPERCSVEGLLHLPLLHLLVVSCTSFL